MIPNKHGTWHFLALAVPLLAVGALFFWIGFKAPVGKAAQAAPVRHSGTAKPSGNTLGQNLSGNDPHDDSTADFQSAPRTAAKPDAAAGIGTVDVRLEVRSMTNMPPDPSTGYALRCEQRELSMAIPDLYRGDTSPPRESLRFPLFDGKDVVLKSLRHQSMGRDQGVVFAEADGEPEGGHVLLSYVGTALAGMIHLPSRGEFYEIRTAPDGRSHILTQLDPEKMPVCAGCTQHAAK